MPDNQFSLWPANPDAPSQGDAGNSFLNTTKTAEVAAATERKLRALAELQSGAEYADTLPGQIAGAGVDSDFTRSVSAGVVSGVGSTVDGVAALTGSDTVENAGAWFRDGADNIRNARGQRYNDAVRRATPSGELFDPSTWDFGDGNLTGLLGLAGEIGGNLAPQLAAGSLGAAGRVAGIAGSTAAAAGSAAVVGGLQGAGGAAQTQWDFIDNLSDAELQEQSGLYADLIETGRSPEEARATVREQAARAAGVAGGTIAAAGGAATQYILRGLPSVLNQVTRSPRLAAAGTSAVEEATQETMESVAGMAAANAVIDSDQNVMEDSLGNALMSGVAGAGISGVSNAGAVAASGARAAMDVAGGVVNTSGTLVSRARRRGADAVEAAEQATADAAGNTEPTPAAGTTSRQDVPAEASDINSPDYDPIRVMRSHESMLARSNVPETRESVQVAADSLLSNHRTYTSSLEMLQQYEAAIPRIDEILADPATEPERAENVRNQREAIQTLLAEDAQANPTPIAERMAQARTTMQELENFSNTISNRTVPNADSPEANTGSGILVRSMRNPTSVSREQRDAAIADTTNGLTTEQRNYLQAVNATENTIEALGGVENTNRGVMVGTDGFKGLPEYRRATVEAVNAGNQVAIDNELRGIRAFQANQANKLNVMREALSRYQSTRQIQQVMRNPETLQWEILQNPVDLDTLRAGNGLAISNNSRRLIQNAENEVAAINAMASEMDALVAMGPVSARQAEPGTPEQPEPVSEERPEDAEPVDETPVAESEPEVTEEVEPASEPDPEVTDDASVTEEPEPATEPEEAPVDDVEPEEPASEVVPNTESADATATTELEGVTSVDLSRYRPRNVAGVSEQYTDLVHRDFVRNPSRGLNKISNLLEYVEENGSVALTQLTPNGLDSQEINALDSMFNAVRDWADDVNLLVVRTPDDGFKFRNWSRFFVTDAEGTLEDNVPAAIAMAAYTYAGESLHGMTINTDDDIRGMTGAPSDSPLNPEVRELLRTAGTPRNMVVRDLGRQVMDLLGLRARDGSVPANYTEELTLSLGAHALAVLHNAGLAQATQVAGNVFASGDSSMNDAPNLTVSRQNKPVTMIRPVMIDAENPAVTPEALDGIRENLRGMPGTLTKVFGNETAVKAPLFEEPDWTQDAINKSDRSVPAELAEAQKAYSKRPWHMRWDSTYGVFFGLPREMQEAFAGILPEGDDLHINEKERRQAKNHGLRRELDNLEDFYKLQRREGGEQIYLESQVWSVQRAGIRSTMLNPQTSKVHRHLMSLDAWRTEVQMDGTDGSLSVFKRGVAEGLGFKADKQLVGTTVAQFDEAFSDGRYDAALDVIDAILENRDGIPDLPALQEAVGNGGMHAFDALVALSKYRTALRTNAASFATDMMVEVDGVTNGPMLTHLFLGIENPSLPLSEIMQKGGFFPTGSEHTSTMALKEANENDLYETVASRLAQRIAGESVMDDRLAAAANAVFGIWGYIADDAGTASKEGRNMVKTPVTASSFGASNGTIAGNMGAELLETVEKRISSLKPGGTNEAVALIRHVNTLLRLGNSPAGAFIPESASITALKKTRWSAEQRKGFITGYRKTFGWQVSQTMDDVFSDFAIKRTVMNSIAATAYETFSGAYSAADTVMERERQTTGSKYRITKTGKQVPMADASRNDRAALKERFAGIFPVTHTYMSSRTNDLSAGLSMYKFTKDPANTSDTRYQQEVVFRKSVDTNGIQGRTHSVRVYGQRTALKEPGVGTLPKSVHSSDSAINATVYRDLPVINLHDAEGGSVTQTTEMARRMNKAAFDVLSGYSLPVEHALAYTRTLTGTVTHLQNDPAFRDAYLTDNHMEFAALTALNNLKDKLPPFMADYLQGSYIQQHSSAVEAYANFILDQALHMEQTKLQTLGNMQAINQYGFEGGHYAVNDTDREAIRERIAAVNATVRQAKQAVEEAVQHYNDITASSVFALRSPEQDARNAATVMQQIEGLEITDLIDQLRDANTQGDDRRAVRLLIRALVNTGDIEASINDPALSEHLGIYQRVLAEPSAPARVNSDIFRGNRRGRVRDLLETLSQDPDTPFKAEIDALLPLIGQRAFSFNGLMQRVAPDAGRRMAFDQYLRRAHRVLRPNPWGTQGRPAQTPDPILDAYLRNNPKITGKQLAKFLLNHTRRGMIASTPMGKFYGRLLGTMARDLDDNTEVVYITPQTSTIHGSYDYDQDSFAFMASKNGKKVIAIRGSDFKASNVTPEAAIHELIHSVVSDYLSRNEEALRNNKLPRTRAGYAMRDLNRIYTDVSQRINDDPELQARFGQVTENMDEFLTWGMSNPEFQQYLATVDYDTRRNAPSGKFYEFIKTLLGFLGFPANVMNTTALGGVLIDGAILLRQAQTEAASVSSNKTMVRNMAANNTTPRNWSTEQIFDSLNGNQQDSERLKDLLRNVINKVEAPASTLMARARNEAAYNPRDIYLNAVLNNEIPFTSRALQVLPMTEQESFVLEQLETVIRAGTDVTSLGYRDLRRIFNEARRTVTPEAFYSGDWANATQPEKDAAQAIHDMIFKLDTSVEGQQDHLSRFAALSQVYTPLREALDFTPTGNDRQTTVSRIEQVFLQILDALTGRLLRVNNTSTADARIGALFRSLAQQSASKAMVKQFEQVTNMEDSMGKLNTGLKSMGRGIAQQGTRLQKSKYRPLRILGNLSELAATDRLGELESTFQHWRNQMNRSRQGVFPALVTETRGMTDANEAAYELHREANNNEKMAVQASEQTRRGLLESFENNGDYLEQADKYALTSVVLETDMMASLGEIDLNTWETIIDDNAAIELRANDMADRIRQQAGSLGNYFVNGAKDMAYHMATGVNRNPHLSLNVDSLLSLRDTPAAGRLSADARQSLHGLVDAYVSTMAVRYTNMEKRQRVKTVMARENTRGEQSGMLTLTMLANRFKQDSLEKVFDNNPMLMKKGYTKEIFNHHNDVVVDTAENEDLLALGYREVAMLGNDPHDTQAAYSIYIAEGGGLRRRETGVVSLTSKRARGSKSNAATTNDPNEVTAMLQNKRNAIRSLFLRGPNYDPDTETERYMVPLRDGTGDVMAYRYMMETSTKDGVMQRHNAFDDVMGGMAANLLNKQTSEDTNRKAVQALYDMYHHENARAENFIRVAADSDDPEIQEAYALMPAAMRRNIREIWGDKALYVPIEQYDMFFGYRRYSLFEVLKRDPDARGEIEKLIAWPLEAMLGKQAALKVMRAENMIVEAMTMIKDIVVIKNLFTLLGNVMSNVSLLMIHGINPVQQIRDHREAIQGLYEYQRDSGLLYRLEARQNAGLTIPNGDIEQEIALLRDSLARNPVRELAEAGLIQTIVEDVEVDDDRFSYRSQFAEKVDDLTNRLPSKLVDAGKFMLVTHDTPLYKLLYRATSTSDFAARYSLFKHLTTRKENPMSHRDAINRVDGEFVNYDIATHKHVDYLNRVGLTMFTKYYLRTQKVIMALMRERPGQALLSSVLSGFLDTFQSIMDSGFWNRIGNNPLTASVLQGPATLDEMLPIKAALSLVD